MTYTRHFYEAVRRPPKRQDCGCCWRGTHYKGAVTLEELATPGKHEDRDIRWLKQRLGLARW